MEFSTGVSWLAVHAGKYPSSHLACALSSHSVPLGVLMAIGLPSYMGTHHVRFLDHVMQLFSHGSKP